jgi:uncharacterized protein (DUF111 family)
MCIAISEIKNSNNDLMIEHILQVTLQQNFEKKNRQPNSFKCLVAAKKQNEKLIQLFEFSEKSDSSQI